MIQMHYSDFQFPILKYNPIKKIKASNLFDQIVLVCPDMKENAIVEKFAIDNNVEIFYGDKDNVLKRMIDAAEHFNSYIIVRPSIRWFMLDTDLIKSEIDTLLQNKYDYMATPFNFDERFGAEIFTKNCLLTLKSIFDVDINMKEKYQFNPAAYIELESHDLRIGYVHDAPKYDQGKYDILKKQMIDAWPADGQGEKYDDRPIHSYGYVKQYIDDGDRILDIACGSGYGTNLLSEIQGTECVGVDILTELIANAQSTFFEKSNLKFICSDYKDLTFNHTFDKIFSFHTMEHIENDEDFLSKMYSFLKNDGELFIEVPILRPLPFENITTPINPDHILEYSIEQFKTKIEKYFKIKNIYGVNHGHYTTEEKTRNAMLIQAKR